MRGDIPPLPNTPSWHGDQLKKSIITLKIRMYCCKVVHTAYSYKSYHHSEVGLLLREEMEIHVTCTIYWRYIIPEAL
jgi:hypothetical protein